VVTLIKGGKVVISDAPLTKEHAAASNPRFSWQTTPPGTRQPARAGIDCSAVLPAMFDPEVGWGHCTGIPCGRYTSGYLLGCSAKSHARRTMLQWLHWKLCLANPEKPWYEGAIIAHETRRAGDLVAVGVLRQPIAEGGQALLEASLVAAAYGD